jgi:hypothetical protein
VPFRHIADSEERSILTTAFQEYCREHKLDPGSPEYEDARRLMVLLYERGGHRTTKDLKAALTAAIRREE